MDNVFARPLRPENSQMARATPSIADRVYERTLLPIDRKISTVLYESRFGRPFSAEALGVDSVFMRNSPNALQNLRAIDTFIFAQLAKNNWSSSQENYKEMLTRVCDMMGIEKQTEVSSKMRRLVAVISKKK